MVSTRLKTVKGKKEKKKTCDKVCTWPVKPKTFLSVYRKGLLTAGIENTPEICRGPSLNNPPEHL